MARRGEAGFATGAAITASTLGSLIGVALLVVFIPVAQPVLAQVQSPELTALAVLGIGLLVPFSRAHPIKGLLSGALGLALATIGLDRSLGEPRFTFGQLTLWDGLGLLPVALGIYAVPEALQILEGASPALRSTTAGARQVGHGCREALRHLGLISRCSLIGAAIGALPGVGASILQRTVRARGPAFETSSPFRYWRNRGGPGPRRRNHGKPWRRLAADSRARHSRRRRDLVLARRAHLQGHYARAGHPPARTFRRPSDARVFTRVVRGSRQCRRRMPWIVTLNSIARVATMRPARPFPLVLTLVMVGTVGERHVVADLAIVRVLGVVGHALAVQGGGLARLSCSDSSSGRFSNGDFSSHRPSTAGRGCLGRRLFL